MTFTKGTILHQRYRIDAQLGRGGMGAVYLAFDQTLQIRVAVKENLNVNPESERQFQREATLLAGLRHPNLPRVTDHFVDEDRQYLVMDFIEGVDLHTRAQQRKPTVEEVLDWADALCDALAYLHSRQPPVIHRDIKPANLKLQPDGVLVLVDFGLAKIFDQGATTTGAKGLTPGFSPPEQYGSGKTDHRTDQYAAAATIYALLTGQPPADSIDVMLKQKQIIPPRSFNPNIPPQVEAALNRALSLEQDDRFPDITSLQQALRGRLQAPTVRSATPTPVAAARTIASPASPPVPAKSRLPLFLGLGGAGVVAVLVIGGVIFGGSLLRGMLGTHTDTPVAAAAATDTPAPPPTTASPPSDTPAPVPTETPAPQTAAAVLLGGGGRIAFVSDREDGRTLQIWTVNPDGTDARQLTYGPGDKTQPRWSPDGENLLFIAPGGKDTFGNDLGLDLWLVNADGTGLVDLTFSAGDESDPAWSRGGDMIAFTSNRISELDQVFVMSSSCLSEPETCRTQEPENVSAGFAVESSPAWSLDDTQLAVSASINGAPGRIFLHGVESSSEPDKLDRRDKILGAEDLRWSVDGSYLLFTWRQPTTNEIYSVPIADASRTEKLTNSAGNKEPAVSPDGQYIAFTSTRDQNPEIYVMTSTGGNEVNLTNSPGSRDLQPDWQPLPPG
jgi:Tol biopolymer transport system component